MVSYKVSLYNDMDHLLSNPSYNTIPKDIIDFVYKKSKNKIFYATDRENLGCLFFILKPDLQNSWTYTYDNDIITIDYSKLNTFDAYKMRRY